MAWQVCTRAQRAAGGQPAGASGARFQGCGQLGQTFAQDSGLGQVHAETGRRPSARHAGICGLCRSSRRPERLDKEHAGAPVDAPASRSSSRVVCGGCRRVWLLPGRVASVCAMVRAVEGANAPLGRWLRLREEPGTTARSASGLREWPGLPVGAAPHGFPAPLLIQPEEGTRTRPAILPGDPDRATAGFRTHSQGPSSDRGSSAVNSAADDHVQLGCAHA
jgi:hypothetical protein